MITSREMMVIIEDLIATEIKIFNAYCEDKDKLTCDAIWGVDNSDPFCSVLSMRISMKPYTCNE